MDRHPAHPVEEDPEEYIGAPVEVDYDTGDVVATEGGKRGDSDTGAE